MIGAHLQCVIIWQILKIKVCKVLELQITQTRHPLHTSDGKKCLSPTPVKDEESFIKCTQNNMCLSSKC